MHELVDAQKSERAATRDNEKQPAQLNLLDLHGMNESVTLSKSTLLQSSDHMAMPLNSYMSMRDAQEENQSYLRTGITSLTRMGRHMVGAEDASAKFDEARKDGNYAAMVATAGEDLHQRAFEHRVSSVSSTALKTALLFSGGKVGLAGLAAVAGADEAKPGDPFPEQATDAVLGAAKGLATRFAYNQISELPCNPVIKGWTLGMTDRLLDVGLTRTTYLNANGDVDLKAGGLKTLNSVFGPQALVVDVGTGLASSAVLMPINAYTGGKFFESPVGTKLIIAGVSGLTEGSLTELNKQQDNPKQPPIDWKDVAKKGLESGAISTISALPSSGLIKLKDSIK